MGELKRAVVSSRKAHFMFSVTRYRFTNWLLSVHNSHALGAQRSSVDEKLTIVKYTLNWI